MLLCIFLDVRSFCAAKSTNCSPVFLEGTSINNTLLFAQPDANNSFYLIPNLHQPQSADRRRPAELQTLRKRELERKSQKPLSSRLNHLTGAGFGVRVAPPHANPSFCVKYGVPDSRGKQNLTMLALLIAPTDSHLSLGFYYIGHFETSLHRLGYWSHVSLRGRWNMRGSHVASVGHCAVRAVELYHA